MEKRHKDIMNALVSRLRHILVGHTTDHGFEPGDLDRELERLGIDRQGEVTPIDTLPDLTNGDGQTYRIAAAQLNRLPENKHQSERREIVERAAYTWINRLLALRAMEVRGLIDDTLRVSEDYGGISEKLYLLRLDSPASATEADGGWWTVLKQACAELATALPGLFSLNDPDAVLHPTASALIQCIEAIGGKTPLLPNMTPEELDATFADPDAIGWAYQFYQAEAKKEIDAKCKIGGKAASRAELAAKTQLFTEPYMVQWLLQNSLGRSYCEGHPQSTLPANWPYYIQLEQSSTPPEKVWILEELTLLDPCMGSGHFLRAAFDMFVAMYREQYPKMSALQIANRILSQHLYGIDLDPRAAQLSVLTLYLRAWEFIKSERKSGDMSIYIPPEMHLATTPTNLDRGAMTRHLERYPDDIVYKPLLEKVFEGLEQADTLGSLLRSREYLDQAIADLQKPHTVSMAFSQAEADLRRDITILAHSDPQQLRQILLDRIAASFHSEAERTDDVSMALFGREAERGVRLLQVLDGQYAVVATNPPYLGSSYMDAALKKYVATHYKAGKRDLYAAFILRCLQLCNPNGRVAMVTMQSWMFLRSFSDLRAITAENLTTGRENENFAGLLRETSIENLAHLGPHAFEEIGGEVVQSTMFSLSNRIPNKVHRIVALRLLGMKSTNEKKSNLQSPIESIINYSTQIDLLEIPETPVVYWLRENFFKILTSKARIKNIADVKRGLDTGNDNRFVRYWWEITNPGWVTFSKGGGYAKWFGFDYYCVDWRNQSIRFSDTPGARVQNTRFYFQPFLTYTLMARGSLGVRFVDKNAIPSGAAGGVYPYPKTNAFLLSAFLNSRVTSYILRFVSPDLKFREGYIANIPELVSQVIDSYLAKLAECCLLLKRYEAGVDIPEKSFLPHQPGLDKNFMLSFQTLRHTIEGAMETIVPSLYQIDEEDLIEVLNDTGTPAGWYPIITSYDTLPNLSDEIDDLPELPQELYDYLAKHERITPNAQELARIKTNLRALYEAGPKAKGVELEEDEGETADKESEEIGTGAHIPIPTETFLEELSVKMQLHPISVYWLLEELRATQDVHCRPEEKRLLEDRFSVLVLRLLGHRWPRQIEAFEPVPDWAVRDGIIPLVPGTGEKTLAERIRERLYAEEGALGAQELERQLRDLTGQYLEQWLRSTFFERHISQFKKRPVAWHLVSTAPKRGTGTGGKKKRKESSGPRTPAFECILYYHACTGDALARIRTQYVEPLLQNERGKIDTTALIPEDTASAFARERILELEEFVSRLRTIEERGFACHELQEIVAEEMLDRWSGNGYQRPESKAAFQQSEESWHVDINDGVRVNIAPLQLAGLLAKEVLQSKDAKKALGDRVRWRVDERRWVREGKLPRCGWMDEQVPASLAWEERQAQSGNGQQQLTLLPETRDENEVRP